MDGMEAVAVGKALPFIKHFPQDVVKDPYLQAMTTLEYGAYMRLRDAAWVSEIRCSLPDDDTVLSGLARLTPEKWSKVKGRVLAGWKPTNGRLYDPRLQALWQDAIELSKKKSAAGQQGGRPKKHNESICLSDGKQMVSKIEDNQNEDRNNNNAGAILKVCMDRGFPSPFATKVQQKFGFLQPNTIASALDTVRERYPGRTLSDYAALSWTALQDAATGTVWAAPKPPEGSKPDEKAAKDAALLQGIQEAQERMRNRRTG